MSVNLQLNLIYKFSGLSPSESFQLFVLCVQLLQREIRHTHTSHNLVLTFGGQSVAAQWRRVPLHGVETGGDQHDVRSELIGDGHHHRPESGRVGCQD